MKKRSLIVIGGLAVVLVISAVGLASFVTGHSGPSAAQRLQAVTDGKTNGEHLASTNGDLNDSQISSCDSVGATYNTVKKLNTIFVYHCRLSYQNEKANMIAQAQQTEQTNIGAAVDAYNADTNGYETFASNLQIGATDYTCALDYNPDNEEVRVIVAINNPQNGLLWVVTTLDTQDGSTYLGTAQKYGAGDTLAGENQQGHQGHMYNCSLDSFYNPSNPYLLKLSTDYTVYTP